MRNNITKKVCINILGRNAGLDLVEMLRLREDVSSIDLERIISINLHVQQESTSNALSKSESEWNLQIIQVPDVWADGFNGTGIVVANIDTGVRPTHEALKSSYRNDKWSWFDPYDLTETPVDDNGHGTVTMGIIVGGSNSTGIGVAPGSKWMACKGFLANGGGYQFALLTCGQFLLCPTYPNEHQSHPDCSKAPRIVNNSWNSPEQNATWFQAILSAWHQAQIIPVFSSGNYGTDCGTVGSQAGLQVIAVGATTSDDELAYFSSVGPSYWKEDKPDLTSPGHLVKSAYASSDDAYVVASGTSMAAPHVSGVIALMLSKDPTLKYDRIKTILEGSADTNLEFSNATCGAVWDEVFPNNHFGHGRLNAYNAMKFEIESGTGTGTIQVSHCVMLLLTNLIVFVN